MKLAVFTSQFPAPVSTFFARDVRGLIEAGIEVEVFPFYPLDESLWQYVPDVLNEDVLPRNRVHHLSFGESLKGLTSGPWRQTATFARTSGAICRGALPIGVEHLVKNIYVLPKAWTWAQRYAGPFDHVLAYWGNYAATCAYLFHLLRESEAAFSMMLRAGMDFYRPSTYMREKLRYADNIIYACDFNREFALDHYPELASHFSEKGFCSYTGLNVQDLSYEPENRPSSKVIAVGGFGPYKGFDYLIEAAHLLDLRGVDCEVEFVGDGEEADHLKNLAARYGLSDRIRFRGWLTYDEAQQAMQQATVLVHPSRQLGDAMPNVVKEAMAVGTPVIASDLAGIPELLDDGQCGELVPPRDVEALADAIANVFADEDLRRRYAAAGREHMEANFDMWKNGERLAKKLRRTTRQRSEAR